MKENQIAALVEANGNFEAQIAKEATEQIEKNRREVQISRAKNALVTVQGSLSSALTSLRNARAAEAKAKEVVVRLGNGISAFKTDGDTRKLAEALYPTSKADQDYFVSNYGATI